MTMTSEEKAALDRLIDLARSDTGGSARAANFLLAWWNAQTCGGFDMTDLWGMDRSNAGDMQIVFGLIARSYEYPTHFGPGYESEFHAIIRRWRPALHAGEDEAA